MTDPKQSPCNFDEHQYIEEYYGYRCTICGDLVPYGCEPWVYLTDEEEQQIGEEYFPDEEYSGTDRWTLVE